MSDKAAPTDIKEGERKEQFFGQGFQLGTSRYRPLKAIGRGAFGVVISAEDQLLHRTVAIKKIGQIFSDSVMTRRVLREIELLRVLRHKNILSIEDIVPGCLSLPGQPPALDHLFIVTEFMDTDLHSIIQSPQSLTKEHLQFLLYQLLLGVAYLHRSHVLHRDLKPSNLLVNKKCELKICDFGLARYDSNQRAEESVAMTEHVVTRWYRAPEVMLSTGRYSAALDMWSVGCIFAELAGRHPLFPGKNYLDQIHRISDVLGKPSEHEICAVESSKARKFLRRLPPKRAVSLSSLFPFMDPDGLDLMSQMLVFDPKARVSAEKALRHPFLKDLFSAADNKASQGGTEESFAWETQDLSSEQLRLMIHREILDVVHSQPPEAARFRTAPLPKLPLGGEAPSRVRPKSSAGTRPSAILRTARSSLRRQQHNAAESAASATRRNTRPLLNPAAATAASATSYNRLASAGLARRRQAPLGYATTEHVLPQSHAAQPRRRPSTGHYATTMMQRPLTGHGMYARSRAPLPPPLQHHHHHHHHQQQQQQQQQQKPPRIRHSTSTPSYMAPLARTISTSSSSSSLHNHRKQQAEKDNDKEKGKERERRKGRTSRSKSALSGSSRSIASRSKPRNRTPIGAKKKL